MNPTDARPVPTMLLRVLAALGMVAGLWAGVAGVVFILDDARTDTDTWDGLGTFLGLLLLGGAVLVLAVLGLIFVLLVRRPRTGLWAIVALACLALLGTLLTFAPEVVASQGTAPWELLAACGAGSLAVLGLAAWGLAPNPATSRPGPGAR